MRSSQKFNMAAMLSSVDSVANALCGASLPQQWQPSDSGLRNEERYGGTRSETLTAPRPAADSGEESSEASGAASKQSNLRV